MSDQESSTSASLTEEEPEGEAEGEGDEVEAGRSSAPGFSDFSATLHAVMRIKQKYLALKKRRLEMNEAAAAAEAAPQAQAGHLPGAPHQARTSPKIFTFDGAAPLSALPQRKKRRRRRRVMFPSGCGRSRAPLRQECSRAKYCLYLLCFIVFLQVYNAIENLDDHVLRYDLEGLEKTLRREVFGQQGAVEGLLSHLKDYLSTYVHNKPLVVSLHGPSGVGKSHLGRLLAGHFRAVVGEALVLQYYVLHHCPQEADARRCAGDLSARVAQVAALAEAEEKIPLFVFDEAEHMHGEILDALRQLVAAGPSRDHLNAVYLFLSNLGHAHVTKHMLHNSSGASVSAAASRGHGSLAAELTPMIRGALERLHPLWAEAAVLPLGLLEKGHVMQCFLEEMSREGFYPDHTNIERLAGEIDYYPAVGGHQYSQTGCKQVVAKVNLL